MKAVFLDRDGVINKPIFDKNRSVYRPPWDIKEVELMPYVIESLKKLSDTEYTLFLITNQPDFVKGLVSINTLKRIKRYIFEILVSNGIMLKNHYYCFHHPDYCMCECRKPSPYFLLQSAKIYNIDLNQSWMIGDRDKDVVCGQRAGTKTILIDNINPKEKRESKPSYTCKNIKEATDIILKIDSYE